LEDAVGRTYLFWCGKCRYEAKVAGGPSEGLEFTVQTILCQECRQLQDAVTAARVAGSPDEFASVRGHHNSPPPFAKLVERLPSLKRLNAQLKSFDLTCLTSPSHTVRAWNQPDKCPHCGTFMEYNGFPFSMWD
jgi:hypothetical protein